MPRYHFDTQCGSSRYHDPDGIELASLAEARQQLAALLRDLTYSQSSESVSIAVEAEVRCDDDVVLRGACTLSIGEPDV